MCIGLSRFGRGNFHVHVRFPCSPILLLTGRLVRRSTMFCRLTRLDCTSLHGTASRFIAFGSVRNSAMCKRRRTPSCAPCIIRVCEASNERRGREVSVLTEHRRNCSDVVSTTCRLPTPASVRANNQCFEFRVQLLLRVRYRSMKCTNEKYKTLHIRCRATHGTNLCPPDCDTAMY